MLSTLVMPGASFTSANGINNAGLIVGQYVDANGLHGFVGKSGNFDPIDVPFDGVIGTVASGINSGGLIAGHFFDNTGEHGFVEDGQSFSAIDEPFVDAPFAGVLDTFAAGINDSVKSSGSTA
jgi:hypothetical protein